MKPEVSIIIPARNEIYLGKTIESLLQAAKGEIEIIAVLDGYWADAPIENPKVTYLHFGRARGMRNAINAGVAVARGKYILKCDAHCLFDEGFDVKLMAECEKNWVVIPRRYALDAETWQISENPRYPVDYMYLSSTLHGVAWNEKNKDPELEEKLIDDTMSAQGSCWFMFKDYFYELELEDEENYGTFANEFQEVGLKCWLSGGRVIVNKKTWYAHLHKNKEVGRGYRLNAGEIEKAANYTKRWLGNTAWHKQTLPFSWLMEKFKPVPTWPEDKNLQISPKMKIYVENFLQDSAIQRISDAIKKYLPKEYVWVDSVEEADFVVVMSYGHRRYIAKFTESLIAQNKKYAVIQLNLKITSNPGPKDWLPIWEKAELVWSYFDLPELCREDGAPVNFNFFYAPLGVENQVFKETKSKRIFLIASTGSGRPWNKECKNEVLLAAKNVGGKVFQMGQGENTDTITYSNGMDDQTLAKYYSQCEFVSGLRRIEGFELPVIEGLLCGARPICFDKPHYRHWFEGLAEFIPEDDKKELSLQRLFTKGARPVAEHEKEYVKSHFNWEVILKKFWNAVDSLNKMDKNIWEDGKKNELSFWEGWLKRKGAAFQNSRRLSPLFDFMIGNKKDVTIANLGAGAMCLIGDRRRDVKVHVVSSDMLADEFEKMRNELGITSVNHIEKQNMTALTYKDSSFDIVYCANALDHCQNPYKALQEMVRICKPGGWIYLYHFAHEGRRQRYHGLHQWNIDVTTDGDCIIWDKTLASENTFLLSDIYPGFKSDVRPMRKMTILTTCVQKNV